MATGTPTETRKRRSREETRQRLLDAALDVFAHNGFERATVDEIVREAGFSKGAFYVHFESKEELFWEMLQDRMDTQQELFRASIDTTLSVEDNQRRILSTIFDLNRQDKMGAAVFLEFVAHAMRDDKVRERLSGFYERWHTFVAETLTAGREAGLVRADADIPLLASVMMAVFEGSMIQSRLAPPHLRLSSKVDQMAALLAQWVTGDKS